MKRVMAFIIFLTVSYLLFQFGVVLFKTSHTADYLLKLGDSNYFINEVYSKNKLDDYYLLTIKVDNKEFIFDIDNTFNKQKNILRDVKVYEEDDLLCIYPIFLNDKTTGELECNIDGKLYSYFGIKDMYDLESFALALPGYNKGFVSDSKIDNYEDLELYINNIKQGERIILYNYKTIFNIANTGINYSEFSLKDIYTNKNGILVGKYYIVPDGNAAGVHEYMTVIDVTNNVSFQLPLRNELSSNYYVNGVVDDVLYIFDKSNLVQYSITPEHRDIRIECTKDSPCKSYIDGKWTLSTAYDMLNKEIKFQDDYSALKQDAQIVSRTNRYYYYKAGDAFYRSYIDAPDKSIQLFANSNVSLVRMTNNNIYYISGDTLYRYSTNSIVPLLKRNEFKFNNYNIYDIYWTSDDKK